MVVKEIREGQDGIVKSISFLDEKFEEMKKVTEKLKIDNQELRNENDSLHKKVNDLGRQINDLDQYHRRVNLEIVGIPENKEEKTEDIVLAVAQRIDPSVKATDIDIAHRIGSPKSGEGDRRPRQIIVRFTNRRARNAVYDGRKRLKGTTSKDLGYSNTRNQIYVNENLVSTTRELLGSVNEARKKTGFKFLWTYNGKIFVKKSEKEFPIIIHTKDDIAKMK